jgi:superfamily II DNA/RNA helicase
MPQFKKAAPKRAANTSAPSRKPGSKSEGHRGYRPDETSAPKKRWTTADRATRAAGAAKAPNDRKPYRNRDEAGRPATPNRRPEWMPREKRAYKAGGERPAYGDRAPRTERPAYGDRPVRAERPAYGGRPTRNDRPARDGYRTERPSRGTRPAYGDRPVRDERPVRRDHDERLARHDRDERPARRDSDFYPTREHKAFTPQDDVVLERLEADAIQAGDVEGITFADLGLGTNIVRELTVQGAESPFPIQAATIPDVLAGRDVLGRGKTGSGKTIAFGAPLVERLMLLRDGREAASSATGHKRNNRQPGRKPRALILAPTRELALQIDRTVQPIARSVGLFTTQIYGGVPQHRQVGALQRGVDIVIGTPGRIEDLIEQGRLDLSDITITVLDEADHMCDLGFLEPVQRILDQTKPGGQRLLFSATLDKGVATLVDEYLDNPTVHEVAGEDQASSMIDHRVLLIEQRDKRRIIEELAAGDGKTLVFTRTRAFAEELSDLLEDAGIPATSLHGDLNQSRRTRNLSLLTSGRVSVLVATDVAARGIHVDDISLVIQADAPEEYKTYLHRAGRTGRAGKQGTVVTLIPKSRRRRMEELLDRAEITAEVDFVAPGDNLLSELAAL